SSSAPRASAILCISSLSEQIPVTSRTPATRVRERSKHKSAEQAMSVLSTALGGLIVFEPEVHRDDRGFFLEIYHRQRYLELGITGDFVQDNHSHSNKGVLRG